MKGEVTVQPSQLPFSFKEIEKAKHTTCTKKNVSDINAKIAQGFKMMLESSFLIMPRHVRLARANYKTSDANIAEDSYKATSTPGGRKRKRSIQSDFWSRIDSGEIDVQPTIDDWRKSMEPLRAPKVDTNMHNFAICTTNMTDYSYKSTAFGDVYYSPRFCDNKYIYRFVILTKGVRNEAYRILRSCGRCFLSESQIIHQLGIDLSPGWEHFMLFRSKLDELILRRPIGT
ncbi:hypothetical protein BgAZ_305150 [Babesia gibsoni]|uniref:Cyclin-dependent kinases regulatory subunit n=1 Tax=Babesia gibsoni TaxID=33632 RepID=A0AAD8PE14_BABGI|nr:hypothetical protein BgAZ_305150 [Babesia gibsoni]